jgi:hypothetical protein
MLSTAYSSTLFGLWSSVCSCLSKDQGLKARVRWTLIHFAAAKWIQRGIHKVILDPGPFSPGGSHLALLFLPIRQRPGSSFNKPKRQKIILLNICSWPLMQRSPSQFSSLLNKQFCGPRQALNPELPIEYKTYCLK